MIQNDSIAYLDFVAAVRSGRDVGAARERTIEVPLDIVRSAAKVVALADQLAAHGNPNLHADAVVAAILAAAAAESAATLVAVNIGDQDDGRLQEAQKLARSLRRPAS